MKRIAFGKHNNWKHVSSGAAAAIPLLKSARKKLWFEFFICTKDLCQHTILLVTDRGIIMVHER